MLGGADNPNGELPSYITGANTGGTYTTTSRFSRPGERCTSHKTFCRWRQKLLRLPLDNCPVTW